jgi:uncharacterized protein
MSREDQTSEAPDDLLDRLEALLDDDALNDSMRLDEVQGFLCAALAGPQALDEEIWLPQILGDENAMKTEAGIEAAGLLRSYAAALEDELAHGEPPALILYAKDGDEEGRSDYAPWCEAYLAGVDSCEQDWFDALGEEDADEDDEEIGYVDERLFPMLMLTGEAEAAAREHGEEWPEGEELETLRNDCEEDLPQAVAELYRFWRAKRGTPTLHRAAPKVGRNDPCPCGSGKKFKNCCGAN